MLLYITFLARGMVDTNESVPKGPRECKKRKKEIFKTKVFLLRF